MRYETELGIVGVKEGTVFLSDGSAAVVLEVRPCKPTQRAMHAYKEWLGALSYPVQIVGRTVNMDIGEQLKIVKNDIEHQIKQKQEYRDLLNQFTGFGEWLDVYMKGNSRVQRLYYIIIPYIPGINLLSKKAKEQYGKAISILQGRSENAINILGKGGIKVRRLGDDELSSLYRSYFQIHNYAEGFNYPEQWLAGWKG